MACCSWPSLAQPSVALAHTARQHRERRARPKTWAKGNPAGSILALRRQHPGPAPAASTASLPRALLRRLFPRLRRTHPRAQGRLREVGEGAGAGREVGEGAGAGRESSGPSARAAGLGQRAERESSGPSAQSCSRPAPRAAQHEQPPSPARFLSARSRRECLSCEPRPHTQHSRPHTQPRQAPLLPPRWEDLGGTADVLAALLR